MHRSYIFALFACAVFSFAALVHAYHALPLGTLSPIAELQHQQEAAQPSAAVIDGSEDGDTHGNSHGVSQGQKADGSAASDEAAALDGAPDVGDYVSQDPDDTSNPDALVALGSLAAQVPEKTAIAEGLDQKSLNSSPGQPENVSLSNKGRGESSTLNRRTDNFNILLLGTDGSKLEMVCVYSINHHLTTELKSVSLFLPVNSAFIYKGRKNTLDNIYASGGWEAVAKAVGSKMHIHVNHYVKIDRQALRDLEEYFEPIYVDGKKVEMETLFVRRTSNEDDRIIARILKQVLRPQVFFRYIPSLVFGAEGDIESNFSFTPKSLAEYYSIGKKLSTKRIEKVVLSGSIEWHNGQRVNIPPEEVIGSAIYRATKP